MIQLTTLLSKAASAKITLYGLTHKFDFFFASSLHSMLKKVQFWSNSRVVLCGKNSPEWLNVFFVILSSGFMPVLVDPSLSVAEKLTLYSIIKPGVIIEETKPEYTEQDFQGFSALVLNLKSPTLEVFEGFDVEIEHLSSSSIDKNTALIIFTSGTTHNSKAVMLSHEAISHNINNLLTLNCHLKGKTIFSPLPWHHIFPLMTLFATLANEGSLITCDQLTPQLFQKVLQENDIAAIMAVPRLLELIKNNLLVNPHYLGNVKYIITGGAPAPLETIKIIESFGIAVQNGYGLAETGGAIASCNEVVKRSGSVGRPFANVSVKILNADTENVGQIAIKSPGMMTGYCNDVDATQKAFNDEGYLLTGDLGQIDADGYLNIVGRTKEIIVNADGKKVSCSQLDEFYRQVPDIQDLAVVGLSSINNPDHEIPYLAIVTAPDIDFSILKEKIFSLANSAQNHWKLADIIFVKHIPKTSLGKVKRYELKSILLDFLKNKKAIVRDLTLSEIEIKAQWEKLLRVENIALDATFLSVGGNSLSAMALYEYIQQKIGRRNIELSQFLAADTIEKQAKLIENFLKSY